MLADNTAYFDYHHNATDDCIVQAVVVVVVDDDDDDAVVHSPDSAEVADIGLTVRPMSAADRTGCAGGGGDENHNSLVRAGSVV